MSATRRVGARLSAVVAPAGPAPTTRTSTSRILLLESMGEAAHLFDASQVRLIRVVHRAFGREPSLRVFRQILYLKRWRKLWIRRTLPMFHHSHLRNIIDHVTDLCGVVIFM